MHLFGTREKNVNMEIYNSKYEQRIQGRFWFCLYLKVCFYEISADISRCWIYGLHIKNSRNIKLRIDMWK